MFEASTPALMDFEFRRTAFRCFPRTMMAQVGSYTPADESVGTHVDPGFASNHLKTPVTCGQSEQCAQSDEGILKQSQRINNSQRVIFIIVEGCLKIWF